MIVRVNFLITCLALLVILAACDEPIGGNGEGELDEQTVDGEQELSFGGSAPGGVFYYLVGVLTPMLTEEVDEANVTNVSTGASVENALGVARGELHFGMTYGSIVNEGWEGYGVFEDAGDIGENIRGVLRAYESPHYFVAMENSGIESMGDLEGATVSMGPPGSGAHYNSDLIMEALDINVEEENLSFDDAADALIEGRIDALGQSGAPSGAVNELSETEDIVIIPFSDDEMETTLSAAPFYEYGELSQDVYPASMDTDEQLPYFSVYWVAHKDVDDELMEELVSVAIDENNREELEAGDPLWEEMEVDVEGFESEYGPPIHPGAVNHFEEEGVEDGLDN